MKILHLNVLGIFILLISLFISSMIYENGDKNAASMYLLIFSIPFIFLSIINCSILKIAERNYSKKTLVITLSFFFPLLSIISIAINDLSLKLVGTVGIIGFGLTNIIWAVSLNELKNKTSN